MHLTIFDMVRAMLVDSKLEVLDGGSKYCSQCVQQDSPLSNSRGGRTPFECFSSFSRVSRSWGSCEGSSVVEEVAS
jgi:hypothetical protein